MIVTRQNRIPFIWVIIAMLPWAFWYFQMQVNGVNFFILNRLISNPATLTLVLGLPGLLFTILPLGAFISFKSDRIWTRWGRRKIFIIVAFSGWVLAFIAYPLAPNIFVFVTIMFVISFFGTFAAPLETLKLEIIPPYLRGRSAAIWSWITTSINIVFYAVVLGRIDETMPFLGFHLGGDKIVFWSAAGAILVALFIYLFGIHEIDPKSKITGEKFRLGTVWKALSMPQLRYLYVFIIATTMLSVGLGPLGTLLYLNQWGYSVQEFGFNVAVGGMINLFLIPIVGIFADMGKRNRMAIYLVCLGMILLLNVVYYCYVTYYLPDQRPSLVEIIFFGETTCVFGIIAGMVYYPLVYDYIPRNIMGTYMAGAGILSTILGFLMLQGIGLFMSIWASFVQPPPGEMTRVCLQTAMPQPQVQQILRSADLVTPAGTKAAMGDITARSWFANGIVQDQGLCYEVRLRDVEADNKRVRRDELQSEIGILEGKLKDEQKRNASSEAVAKDIVPQKYNYLVGYLYVFASIAIGFLLVRYIIRMVKAGKTRKVSAEVSAVQATPPPVLGDAKQAAAPDISGAAVPEDTGKTHTPGYLAPQLLLIAAGTLLMLAGIWQGWPSLCLLIYGRHADANAVSVIAQQTAELTAKKNEHDALVAELDRRAAAWQAQVEAGLKDQLMKPGSEVLHTTPARTVVCVLPTTRKPTDTELDKLNRSFRAENPDLIGLRAVLQADRSFALSVSAALPDEKDPQAQASDACRQVKALAQKITPRLIAPEAAASAPTVQAAEIVDVAMVENPVRNFVSAISRVVNSVISLFTEVPPPDQKLHSLARGLCKLETIAHARVDSLRGQNGVRIFAVANTAMIADPADWRAQLLEQTRKEGASLKLTVLKPVVAKEIVPQQYNYMVGYLYVFFMVGVGFLLVLYFIRMERIGKVRKLGAEEAEVHDAHHQAREDAKKAAAAAKGSVTEAPETTGETYTPGYLTPKLLLMVSGLLLTVVAAGQAWPSLRLLAYGQRADAMVVAVIAHKEGLPEVTFKTQAELTAKLEEVTNTKDYAWTFFNQFAYEPEAGKEVVFRRDVGCKLRPPMPLLDDNGLPTSAAVRYDPAKPELAILPMEYSTWFAPVLTGILGIMTIFTGAILAWYARKPIVLQPSAPTPEEVAAVGA